MTLSASLIALTLARFGFGSRRRCITARVPRYRAQLSTGALLDLHQRDRFVRFEIVLNVTMDKCERTITPAEISSVYGLRGETSTTSAESRTWCRCSVKAIGVRWLVREQQRAEREEVWTAFVSVTCPVDDHCSQPTIDLTHSKSRLRFSWLRLPHRQHIHTGSAPF